MIIFGFGKITRKIIGRIMEKQCNYCNQLSIWELCLVRTWFTLFFIPIIPYKKQYMLMCPHCGSYMALSKEQFEEMKMRTVSQGGSTQAFAGELSDEIKYPGKTPTQIAYIKQMEAYKNEQKEKQE